MSQHNHLYRPVGEDQCANLSNIELSQSTFEYQVNEPPSTKHTYSSFPSPVSGRSPTLPSFRIPKYGYFGLDGPAGARSPTSSPVEFVHPGSSADVRKNSVFRALIQSINYFMGVSFVKTMNIFDNKLATSFVILASVTDWRAYVALRAGHHGLVRFGASGGVRWHYDANCLALWRKPTQALLGELFRSHRGTIRGFMSI